MNPVTFLINYIRGAQTELRKVTWPTAPVVAQSLVSVIVGIALFTAFIGSVDYVFIKLLAFIIK